VRHLCAILLFSCLSIYAKSQSFSQNTTGKITIASVMNISVSTGTAFSFSTIDNYLNGVTKTNFSTVTVKSNNLWLVNVQANAVYFTAGGGGSTDMPASILSIRKAGTGSYQPISSTANVTLNTGSRTGSSAPYTNTFDVDLIANPGFNFNGGTYSIGLIYTLTSQ
jgi:hypothetical protein